MSDVIVVGAGPAGSSAAAALAQAGRHVLLVDRSRFPRDKICGDAVQGGAIDLLRQLGYQGPFEADRFTRVAEWTIEVPSRVVIGAKLHSNSHDTYIARRIDFDQLVYQQALANGADFCQAQVTGLVTSNDRVLGVTAQSAGVKESFELRAPVVIAADGATSSIARTLIGGREADRHWAVAIRGYIKMKDRLNHRCEFYFPKVVVPGYGWIFPVGEDSANIGVGMRLDRYRKGDISLGDLFNRFLDMLDDRIDRGSLEQVKSWQLPLASKPVRRVYDGCILVGDAGHFVDPLLGAGIYAGMRTGYLAAQVVDGALRDGDISEQRLSEFDKLWRKEMGSVQARSTLVQRVIVSHPWALNLIAGIASRNSTIGRLTIMGLSGEKL